MAGLLPFFKCFLQHLFGIVDADHVIARFGEELGHDAGPAAQIQDDVAFHAVSLLQLLYQPSAPGYIIHIVLKQIIDACKPFIIRASPGHTRFLLFFCLF